MITVKLALSYCLLLTSLLMFLLSVLVPLRPTPLHPISLSPPPRSSQIQQLWRRATTWPQRTRSLLQRVRSSTLSFTDAITLSSLVALEGPEAAKGIGPTGGKVSNGSETVSFGSSLSYVLVLIVNILRVWSKSNSCQSYDRFSCRGVSVLLSVGFPFPLEADIPNVYGFGRFCGISYKASTIYALCFLYIAYLYDIGSGYQTAATVCEYIPCCLSRLPTSMSE